MNRVAQAGILGLCIAVGLIGAGALLRDGIRDVRRADRYVTVKGLVERDVAADLAVWPLKTRVAGDDLAATQQELERNVGAIRQFLTRGGMAENEVTVQGLRVVDRRAQEYGEARADQLRYVIEATVQVRSNNVEQINKVSQQTSELVKSGVTLSEEDSCNSGPIYLFTRLNAVKPEMLAEATRNARASAGQFAADSNSRVGVIRRANQGVFSIASRDQLSEGEERGGCGASDLNKKIRVVTTVDYYLEE